MNSRIVPNLSGVYQLSSASLLSGEGEKPWEIVKSGLCIIMQDFISIALDITGPSPNLKLPQPQQLLFRASNGEEISLVVKNQAHTAVVMEYNSCFSMIGKCEFLNERQLIYTPLIGAPKSIIGTNHLRIFQLTKNGMILEKENEFRFTWSKIRSLDSSIAA